MSQHVLMQQPGLKHRFGNSGSTVRIAAVTLCDHPAGLKVR